MKTLFLRRSAAVLFAASAMVVSIVGCSDNGTTPRDTYSDAPSMLARPNAKLTEGEEATIEDSTQVAADVGAAIEVGDDQIGSSSVDVPADAIDSTENSVELKFVKMRVQRFGAVTAELGPHGYHFRRSVWFTLSYKGADLTGVDESKLTIMYLNEDVDPPVWENVEGSVVNTWRKTVSAPLSHFSRYGIGSDE